ncbi:heme peroxidase [Coprinopsis marcescibilis]|uniref:Peroxidase n=1 Tax=Coprinopsis marcescibilis TaxID=230819 RepID=A0A5C3L3N3_COPMA|nr:heme peroxidase [Coprinopsis marcescibilis]
MKFATFVALSVVTGVFASPQDAGTSTITIPGIGDGIQLGPIALCSNGRIIRRSQCCKWFRVIPQLQTEVFNNGQCHKGTRRVLQTFFHDAIGFSPALTNAGQFGSLDGSIIAHSGIETTFIPNRALGPTIEALRSIAIRNGVSFGDILNFANTVGLGNCPGAPKLEFLAGKSNSSQVSPPGLIPGPGNSATTILNRMGDAGFTSDETVDLLAAHTIASQEALNLNPASARAPFDSTPAVFDSQVFIEVLLKGTVFTTGGPGIQEVLSPLPGEFRMQSDFALARDPRTSCRWQSNMSKFDFLDADLNLIANTHIIIGNSALVASRFRAAVAKLSVLGFDRNTLDDCSDVVPNPRPQATNPHIPGGLTNGDLEGFCAGTPLPTFPESPGPLATVAAALP